MFRSTGAKTFVLAVLVVAGGSKSQPAADHGSGSGSAKFADPCPADVDVHVNQAMDATEAYFTKLVNVMKPWSDVTSCDSIKTALEGVAADGDAYAEVIDRFFVHALELSEACRDSLDSKWDSAERPREMEQNFRFVVDGGLGHVKRCVDAPGVKDAAMHAIRLMKKRS
jgi:hypothetical protein